MVPVCEPYFLMMGCQHNHNQYVMVYTPGISVFIDNPITHCHIVIQLEEPLKTLDKASQRANASTNFRVAGPYCLFPYALAANTMAYFAARGGSCS